MDAECPYCGISVDVTRLAQHVRLVGDEEHGPHGAVPEEGFDNPWSLRLDFDEPTGTRDEDALDATLVRNQVRRGRCPACELGVLGLKGGDGFLSSGRRRLACPNCRWESPEWIEIT